VRSDGLAVLRMAYEAHDISTNEPLEDEEQEDLVIRTFMLFYTMPWMQDARSSSEKVHNHLQKAHKSNPAWSDTMLWIQDMKQSATYQHVGERNPFSTRRVFFGDYPSMVPRESLPRSSRTPPEQSRGTAALSLWLGGFVRACDGGHGHNSSRVGAFRRLKTTAIGARKGWWKGQ